MLDKKNSKPIEIENSGIGPFTVPSSMESCWLGYNILLTHALSLTPATFLGRKAQMVIFACHMESRSR